MTRPAAIPTVQIDNEKVKVTEWRFAPAGRRVDRACASPGVETVGPGTETHHDCAALRGRSGP